MRLVGLNVEFSGQKIKGTEQFPPLLLVERRLPTWNSELRLREDVRRESLPVLLSWKTAPLSSFYLL